MQRAADYLFVCILPTLRDNNALQKRDDVDARFWFSVCAGCLCQFCEYVSDSLAVSVWIFSTQSAHMHIQLNVGLGQLGILPSNGKWVFGEGLFPKGTMREFGFPCK